MTGYEIKSGQTFSKEFFKGLQKWSKLSGTPKDRLNVIYGGSMAMATSEGNVIPFPNTF